MDPHVRWLRRHLASSVTRRLGWEAATVATAVLALAVVLDSGIGLAVPWAFIAAQLTVIGHLVLALRSGAFSRSATEAYTNRRLVFVPDDVDVSDELSQLLVRRDLEPVSRLRAKSDDPTASGDPTIDVFQTANRITTAMRCRNGSIVPTDSLRLTTKLNDGRCLVTTSTAMVPLSDLLINLNPGALPTALLDTHVRAVKAIAAKGLRPVTTGPEVAVDLLLREQEALAELGPFFAPFLARDRRRSRLGLLVAVPPSELRRLGLTVPVTIVPPPKRRARAGQAA